MRNEKAFDGDPAVTESVACLLIMGEVLLYLPLCVC